MGTMKELIPGTATFEPGRNPNVTAELLDMLIAKGIRPSDLEEPLFFRCITAGRRYLRTTVEELVDVDLSGKFVYAYFPNWEDSEWVGGGGAVTVVREDDGIYRFGYSPKHEACREHTCSHEDEDDCLDSPSGYYGFRGYAQAIVVWSDASIT